MKINQAGIELIKEFEGFSDKAYKCPGDKWTIGYGHVLKYGKCEDVITKEQAEVLLHRDVADAENAVKRLVQVRLNANQFSALVSFTFNLGAGNLGRSTLLRKLNARDYEGAADEFGRWVYANKRKLKGLVKRREAEKQLFLTKE